MTHAAILFALSVALLVGALLTMVGVVVEADSPRYARDLGMFVGELRLCAVTVALLGLLTFIAAACAILGTIGSA